MNRILCLLMTLLVAREVEAALESPPDTWVTIVGGEASSGAQVYEVDKSLHLFIPGPGVQAVAIDYVADGAFVLNYGAKREGGMLFFCRWCYRALAQGAGAVRVDFRESPIWSWQAMQGIDIVGTGRFTVTRMQALTAPPNAAAADAARDNTVRWMPERPSFVTINEFAPFWWSVSSGLLVPVLIGSSLVVLVLVAMLVGISPSWRRYARYAIVVSVWGAFLLFDAYFLTKFLPMVETPRLDAQARIRDGIPISPQVGALAAMSRDTIASSETVGIMADPADWFSPQTICYFLAPRRCVILRPGEREHRGISGVGRLEDSEIDVVIAFNAPASPSAYRPVASLNRNAVIARRQ